MAFAAGVDVGSTQTKAVIIDEGRRIVARALTDTGANVTRAAETAFRMALQDGDRLTAPVTSETLLPAGAELVMLGSHEQRGEFGKIFRKT